MVSDDGPVDFNVMMQEGVKALTKILTAHLQDHPSFINQQPAKLSSAENENKIESSSRESQVPTVNVSQKSTETDIDEDKVEELDLDNNSNYHMREPRKPQKYSISVPYTEDETKPAVGKGVIQKRAVSAGTDLDCDELEGELVFDYGEQDLMALQNEFGDSIKKMVASTISQEVDKGQPNIDIDFEVEGTLSDCHDAGQSPLQSSSHRQHQKCRHGNSSAGDTRHLEFEYPHNPKHTPNFASLITYDKPICMFCEYYFVFGEPPKNMIRWFYKNGGKDTSAQCPSFRRRKNSHTQR